MKLLSGVFLFLISFLPAAQDCMCTRVTASSSSWIRMMYQDSEYVFYGRVDSVEPPLPTSNEVRDQPNVTVLTQCKGAFSGGQLRGAACGSGIIPGESAVFFLDGDARIKSCSIRVDGVKESHIKSGVSQLSRQGT